jgi:hypothetical protein
VEYALNCSRCFHVVHSKIIGKSISRRMPY